MENCAQDERERLREFNFQQLIDALEFFSLVRTTRHNAQFAMRAVQDLCVLVLPLKYGHRKLFTKMIGRCACESRGSNVYYSSANATNASGLPATHTAVGEPAHSQELSPGEMRLAELADLMVGHSQPSSEDVERDESARFPNIPSATQDTLVRVCRFKYGIGQTSPKRQCVDYAKSHGIDFYCVFASALKWRVTQDRQAMVAECAKKRTISGDIRLSRELD